MKRSFYLSLLSTLLLGLLLAGCAARPAAKEAADYYSGGASAPAAAPMPAGTPAPLVTMALEREKAARGAQNSVAPEEAADGRKIIYTANLQLVVQETEKTVEAIKNNVVARGGFVSSANVWQQGNLLRGNLMVRVPAEQMEAFLQEVKDLAIEVQREETGGQDVTEEYVDIEARLKNLEATEVELRELLTEVREKTGKAEDVMAVYRELANVRSEIEVYKGRMQYLDRMTQLATVNIDLSERALEPIGRPGWQPLQTVRRALNGLVQAAKFGVDAVIWIVLFVLPLLAVPALVIWLVAWLIKRRNEKKKAERLSKPESLS